MKDWKIIAISATLAFLFSFIPGLIGSVSTGVLLFRAFMGAIVFGLMGFGFSVLLRRYLPELFEFRSSSSRLENDSEIVLESDDSSIGQSTIDISIDDETENTLLNSD
jgi:hypothetical protein